MEEVEDDGMDGCREEKEGWMQARVHSRSDHGSSAAAVALHIASLREVQRGRARGALPSRNSRPFLHISEKIKFPTDEDATDHRWGERDGRADERISFVSRKFELVEIDTRGRKNWKSESAAQPNRSPQRTNQTILRLMQIRSE